MAERGQPPDAAEIVLYEKDPGTRIATITLNRPDRHNAPTIAARHRFAALVHRTNVDDDVTVLVIRGSGDHFGTGADLPEMSGMFGKDATKSLLHEFKIGEDEG